LTKINFTSQNALKLICSNVEFQKQFPGHDMTPGIPLQAQGKGPEEERGKGEGE